MDLRTIGRTIGMFAVRNSPAILTGIGVTGLLTTTALTARASFKAAELIRLEEYAYEGEYQPLDKKEMVRLVWKLYIPPAATGLIAVACIIGSTRISVRRGAALAAAYSVLERGMEEYQDKVVERLGESKEQSIRDEIAQDRVTQNNRELIIVAGGDVPCLDSYSGRPFTSSMETLLRAEAQINHKTHLNLYASLSDFYEMIGLDPIDISDDVGWTADNILKLDISSAVKDGRPWLVVSFNVKPVKI